MNIDARKCEDLRNEVRKALNNAYDKVSSSGEMEHFCVKNTFLDEMEGATGFEFDDRNGFDVFAHDSVERNGKELYVCATMDMKYGNCSFDIEVCYDKEMEFE